MWTEVVPLYLCKKGFIDLHPRVGVLRQQLIVPLPAVVNRRVGVGDAAEEHRPFKIKLLLRFSNALMDRDVRDVQICGRGAKGLREGVKERETKRNRRWKEEKE